MDKYELEFLSEEFGRHIETYTTGPYYEEKGFNLPLALKTIVDEVILHRKACEGLVCLTTEMMKQTKQIADFIEKLTRWGH